MRTQLLFVVLLSVSLTSKAAAFDTGHHSDLTHAALVHFSFSEDATQAVQVCNWLTDFYSLPFTKIAEVAPSDLQPVIDEFIGYQTDFEKLHFDCVFSTDDIAKYWNQLAINTQKAISDAARDNDEVKFLSILGMSLHVVQDFYTHSNWPETHPRQGDQYRTETWWNSPPARNMKIYTGWYENLMFPTRPPQAEKDHGDYNQGLNHDAYQRPKWDEAYVFAFAASCEWTAAVCQWAEQTQPGFLARVRAHKSEPNSLRRDVAAAYRISEWISIPSVADGHWKGPGSGRLKKFPGALLNWAGSQDSVYVKAIKEGRYQSLLTKNLYGNEPQGSVPSIASFPLNHVAVSIRTLHVKNEGFSTPFLPNYYAKLILADRSSNNQQTFIEAMQNRYKSSIDTAWWTMYFVEKNALARANGQVVVHYGLYDEGNDAGYPLPRTDDRHYNIKGSNDADKDLRFFFDVTTHACSGDIVGTHDSRRTAVTSKGSSSNVGQVTFYVTSNQLASP